MVNSYLKQFAALYAMVYDSKRMAAYGKYQGYDVVIQDATQQAQYVIQMAVNGTTPYFVEQTAQFVQSLNFPFVNYAKYENLTITVSVKNKPRKIQEYFGELLQILRHAGRDRGLQHQPECGYAMRKLLWKNFSKSRAGPEDHP